MTVKELIAKLEKFPEDAIPVIRMSECYWEVEEVSMQIDENYCNRSKLLKVENDGGEYVMPTGKVIIFNTK